MSHLSEFLRALKGPPGEWIYLKETRKYQGNIAASNAGRPETALNDQQATSSSSDFDLRIEPFWLFVKRQMILTGPYLGLLMNSAFHPLSRAQNSLSVESVNISKVVIGPFHALPR